MQITKYRTVAIIYPHLSLECEVVDGDKKYYPNISVNDKGKKEEPLDDNHWCYSKPMDQLGYDEKGNEIDYDKDMENSLCEINADIYKQMVDFWNTTPVFVNDATWKDWPERTEKYLIYWKYRAEDSRYFLASVAESQEEAKECAEDYAKRKEVTKIVPVSEIFTDCEGLEEQIRKLLDELGITDDTLEMKHKEFSLKVTGDWKHEHLHTNQIIEKTFNCKLISEDVTEEDGSDFYTAIHTYKFS